MMDKSESLKELAAALAKAQVKFPAIPRSKTVKVHSTKGSYSFNYAPFEEIIRAVRPVLSENGLAFTQGAMGDRLITTVLHSSGEWFSHETAIINAVGSAQAYGSALTYAKRYGFCGAFGIQADDDDDANAAEGNHVEAAKDKPGKGPTITPVTGMFDSLPIDMQNAVLDIVHRTESLFKRGDEAGAWEEWSVSIRAISEEPHGDIARAVAWNQMDSKVRTALAKRVPKPTKEAA